jgi:hypothetical protein
MFFQLFIFIQMTTPKTTKQSCDIAKELKSKMAKEGEQTEEEKQELTDLLKEIKPRIPNLNQFTTEFCEEHQLKNNAKCQLIVLCMPQPTKGKKFDEKNPDYYYARPVVAWHIDADKRTKFVIPTNVTVIVKEAKYRKLSTVGYNNGFLVIVQLGLKEFVQDDKHIGYYNYDFKDKLNETMKNTIDDRIGRVKAEDSLTDSLE